MQSALVNTYKIRKIFWTTEQILSLEKQMPCLHLVGQLINGKRVHTAIKNTKGITCVYSNCTNRQRKHIAKYDATYYSCKTTITVTWHSPLGVYLQLDSLSSSRCELDCPTVTFVPP
jgi:hypothetical protein